MTSGNIYVKNYYSNINGMNIQDCNKITELLNSELNTDRKDFFKKERNKCRRLKAMCDLEYFISFFNCTFAFLCCIFGFLIEDWDYEFIPGVFGIIFCIIGFIINLIYVIYNRYIFLNDSPSYIEYTDLIKMSTKNLILYNTPIDPVTYPYPKNGLIKTDSNGIYAIYDQDLQRYQLKYAPEKNGDIYASYAKYSDLYSSVYNFNKTLYIKKYYDNYNCIYTDLESISNGKVKKIFYKDNDDNLHICDNLYYYELSNFPFISYNKYLYDRWKTAFALDIVIIILQFNLWLFSIVIITQY
jgi:hypothetical protein